MYTKRWSFFIAALVIPFLYSCTDDTSPEITAPEPQAALASGTTGAQAAGGTQVEDRYTRAESEGTWSELTPVELWDYVAQSDTTVIVGLKPADEESGVREGQILLKGQALRDVREGVLGESETRFSDTVLIQPAVRIHVSTPGAIARLRARPTVEYVEPAMYRPGVFTLFSAGCGDETWTGQTQYYQGDYGGIKWATMGIPQAWDRSQGSGITIGLIDTGIDPLQPELNASFSSGSSTGRTISNDWTSASHAWQHPQWADDCGHGTHMAGTLAAPKNGTNLLGIAWKASLVSVKHASDVLDVFTDGQKTSDAINLAAGTYGANILVMAFKTANNSLVRNTIQYWHSNNRLLVGAAGTNLFCPTVHDVVFPAQMTEVIAVTGAEGGFWNPSLSCGSFYGPEVELAAFDGQPTTSSPLMGGSSSVLSKTDKTSNASAIIAGIAALAWAEQPTLTAEQVRSRLRQAGHRLGMRAEPFGYGVVNAFGAVGGLWHLLISGNNVPSVYPEQPTTYSFQSTKWGGSGNFSYSWAVGEGLPHGSTTGPTVSVTVGPNDDPGFMLTLLITDLSDGTTLSTSQYINVLPAICQEDPEDEECEY